MFAVLTAVLFVIMSGFILIQGYQLKTMSEWVKHLENENRKLQPPF